MPDNEELLTFFKALSDANRLKIVGLLAKEPHTVEQLSALLGVSPSTISHHLSKLAEAGLVTASAHSYYNFYRLESAQIESMARRLTASDTFPDMAPSQDGASPAQGTDQAYDHKTVHNYLLPNGRLKTIPAQRKKLMAVLRYLAESFEPGRRYTESEVNEILARFHADTASLRRELIGAGLMERESAGQAYWRSEQ
jgi:biotin operon repressor